MKQQFTITLERDEAGWIVGEVVELPGCHTQAKTKEELLVRMKEAIVGYLQAHNKPVQGKFIGLEHIEV